TVYCSLTHFHLLFSYCVLFFFYCPRDTRVLPSFPTRRSSDLSVIIPTRTCPFLANSVSACACWANPERATALLARLAARRSCSRSEEHTSELQSLAYLVCRLLLEKKK